MRHTPQLLVYRVRHVVVDCHQCNDCHKERCCFLSPRHGPQTLAARTEAKTTHCIKSTFTLFCINFTHIIYTYHVYIVLSHFVKFQLIFHSAVSITFPHMIIWSKIFKVIKCMKLKMLVNIFALST